MEAVNNIETKKQRNTPVKNMLSEKRKKLIFYIIMFAPLVLHVAIFYIYVNVSNIGLAFTQYFRDSETAIVSSKFVGFENFSFVINFLFSSENSVMFIDTFIMYGVVLLIAMPVGIFFSYYIYKKFLFAEFFRVVLFFPQVLSAVAMTVIYKTILNDVVMFYTGIEDGLLGGYGSITTYAMIILYTLWMSFGGNILLYCGAMSGINESIVEACHLDGCGVVGEFIHVILPSIYPTIITFVLIDICAIFTQNMNLYTFYGENPLPKGINGSIGYFLVVQTAKSDYYLSQGTYWNYSQLAALGLLITCVTLPVSLIVRRLMTKFGPSED